MPRNLFPLILTLLCSITPCNCCSASDRFASREMPAQRTDAAPTIDGNLDDACWKTAPSATTFLDQQNGTPVPDQTQVRVLYDQEFIYLAFHCLDSHPDRIVARETVRDQKFESDGGGNEDNIEVDLDPYLTHRSDDFARFSVNPLGTRSAHITGGRGGKAEWKGDWDAAAKRTAQGWDVEIRIPWKILSYPHASQPINFGINFGRFQASTRTYSVWSNIGPQSFQEFEGVWKSVQPPVERFKPHLSILPYLLPQLNGSSFELRAGGDARYRPTSQLTAVASVNPDFGTIEGAIQGINFSRSERFIPERRPYFLEGADYFQMGSEYGIGRYFYSNRIPAFSTGAKFFGKVSSTDTIGVLDTNSFGSRNDLVATYRHDISPTTNISGFAAQKDAIGDHNSVGVVTFNSRIGKLGINGEAAESSGTGAGGGAHNLGWNYSDKALFTTFQLFDVSSTFRDADGLIGFTDYRGGYTYQEWSGQWRKGFWRSFDASLFTQLDWHTNGMPFRRGVSLSGSMEARKDWGFGLGLNWDRYDDQGDRTVNVWFTNGVSNRFRQWGINLQTGIQADRPSTYIGPQFQYRVFRRLQVAYNGQILSLDGANQQHILTANYEFSPTRSLGGRVVVQNSMLNWYLSYRSSGEKGTELFFILGDPNADRYRQQIAVKIVFSL